MGSPALVGLDVGTTGVKALALSEPVGVRAFNIAEPTAISSNVGFVQLCAEVAGVEARIRHVADDSGPVFDGRNCVFPFPNQSFLLDTTAARKARLQPEACSLREMIAEAHRFLLANPERRAWARGPAELRHLEPERR